MLRRFQVLSIFVDILLFSLSVTILTYLAQTSQWILFMLVSLLCIILYSILQYSKTKPVLDKLDLLHKEQHLWVQKTQEVGIVTIYNMQDIAHQDERNQITAEIINSGNVFSILSMSATSYIDPSSKRHWAILRPKIEKGAPFRMLLMNPFCCEKRVRNELNYGTLSFDPQFRFDLLYDLYNCYPNVDIKITSLNLYCSLFFTEEYMLYDPYHLGKIGQRLENQLIAVQLKNIDKSFSAGSHDYYDILKKHFEYLWLAADGFEKFLLLQNDELQSTQYRTLKIHSRLQKQI